MNLNISFILESTKGEALYKKADSFSGIGTNSKEELTDRLFVALKGSRFDAHSFLKEACLQGATGFLIHDKTQIPQELKQKTVIQVDDTLLALQNLASCWREKLHLKVLAITGTNGKTTTKDFLKTLIPESSSSQKSFNNQFGVPLSLLSETREGAFFIQELGVSRKGDLAPLCRICDPYVSAITMIGPAHLEGLGSVEEVSEEKKQIYLSSPRASFVFNRDNAYTEKMFQELRSRCASYVTFSSHHAESDVFFQIEKETQKEISIKGKIQNQEGSALVKVSGVNLENLMCASAMALACAVPPEDIWERLVHCKTPFGRQNWFRIKRPKVSVLFDAYNANPSSMEVFFKKCEEIPGRKIFILGDMKELGKDSEKYHKQLADYKVIQGASSIWYIGDYGKSFEEALKNKSYQGKFLRTEDYEKTYLVQIKKELQGGDFVGLKASRGIGLERALFDLTGDKS